MQSAYCEPLANGRMSASSSRHNRHTSREDLGFPNFERRSQRLGRCVLFCGQYLGIEAPSCDVPAEEYLLDRLSAMRLSGTGMYGIQMPYFEAFQGGSVRQVS